MDRENRGRDDEMKRLWALCGLIAFLFSFSACGGRAREPLQKTAFFMDTFVTITIYEGGDEAVLEEAVRLCGTYEGLLSRTIPDSDVSRMNHAQGALTAVSSHTREILQRGIRYSELTDGKYDLTVCPLVDRWDFSGEGSEPPPEDQIRAARELVGWEKIALEEEGVRLLDGAQVDLGSIAKGYIADRIAAAMQEQGVRSAIINLGGDVLCIGGRGDGAPFRIGVQKPFGDQSELLGSIELTDGAVASSGVYERYFWEGDSFYHHILDPATGYPAETGLTGVTVVCASAMECDALATSIFLLGPEEGLALAERMEGVEAILLTSEGGMLFTSGFGEDVIFTPAQAGE